MADVLRHGLPSDVRLALQAQAVSYSDSASDSCLARAPLTFREVASAAVITYDVITTVSDQIDFLQSIDRTYLRIGYVLVRYLPWLAQLGFLPLDVNGSERPHWSGTDCRVWGGMQVSVMQFMITTVDAIQMLRIYVLLRRHTYLLFALYVIYAAEVLIVCVILGVSFHHTGVDIDCVVTRLPRLMMAYWLTPLVFQTILFVLTLYKFIIACRNGWGHKPVMKLFIADGTWAFMILFFSMLLNFVLSYTQHGPYAVISFRGTRLLNNPRRVLCSSEPEPESEMSQAATIPKPGAEVELDTLFDMRIPTLRPCA
ncbi:hypothetical protein EVG20_g9800 [Dentipellis fragilis]|uniref:Uncharacterized protein n=1 Tax=Dentipellis fragilis TaxID=205917 RepID=A0A4Y9XVV3_9AGAM|nr:hypothetical protein EVG20_g9800 [Dentipellis fragilis]